MRRIAAIVSMALAAALAAPAAAQAVVPTQFVAKLFTEGLGRAPSGTEWSTLTGAYGSGCTWDLLNQQGAVIFTGDEFTGIGYDNAEKLLALYRAALSREPIKAEIDAGLAALSDGQSWASVVADVFDSSEFRSLAWNEICNPTIVNYGFNGAAAGDLRQWVDPNGTPSRTQAQLQSNLNGVASSCGIVRLLPKEVVRIGGDQPNLGPDYRPLKVPPCVTLTTLGAVTPGGYAHMGRLVPKGPLCDPLLPCYHRELVQLGDRSKLSHVWVDGKGVGAQGSKIALVGVGSGTNTTDVVDNRLSDPPGDGTAVRAAGYGTTARDCAARIVSRNLITGYARSHGQSRMGKALGTDGLSIFCEQATVADNDIIDISDAGIIVYGSWNSGNEKVQRTQRSTVVRNSVVSAGISAYVAYGAEAVGECLSHLSDGTGPPVSCIEFSHDRPYSDGTAVSKRSFTGTSFNANKFWTGSRTHFDTGLMIGSASTFGDNGPQARGASFTNNISDGVTPRVHIGIAVSGMRGTTLSRNRGSYTVIDANPSVTEDKCPQGNMLYDSSTASITDTSTQRPVDSPGLYHCFVPHPPAAGMDRIEVAPGNRTFRGTDTQQPFNPWGHGDGLDHQISVADLREVKEMGANVVRLHIQFKDLMADCANAKRSALEELSQTLRRAEQNGVYLDITGLASYAGDSSDPQCYREAADETARWAAQAAFWGAVARTVKRSNAVFALDLMNEPAVMMEDQDCWAVGADPKNYPPCGRPFGDKFFLQNITKDLCLTGTPTNCPRTKAQITKAWVSQMIAAIRNAGDTHPITVGCLTAGYANCGGLDPATLAPHLDYLSVHLYPKDCTVEPKPSHCSDSEASEERRSGNPFTHENVILQTYSNTGDPVVVEETYPLFVDGELVRDFIGDAFSRGLATGFIGHWEERTLSQVTVESIVNPDRDERIKSAQRMFWGRAFQWLTSTISPCGACQP